jgi:hypothetical protein
LHVIVFNYAYSGYTIVSSPSFQISVTCTMRIPYQNFTQDLTYEKGFSHLKCSNPTKLQIIISHVKLILTYEPLMLHVEKCVKLKFRM